MNHPRDKPSQEPPGKGTGDIAAGQPQPADQRSGRIAHDERGNPVREWQLETGVYTRDVDTQRLKKLDLNDLSIADTGSYPRPPGLTDPNDNSSTAGGNVGDDSYNSAGRGALKPLDPKKLQEWMELRKRAEPNKEGGG